MATTVQNSDKKYLNFSGLAYYDEKIKAWVNGKKYITNDALAGYATETWVGQNYQPKGNYQAAGNYIVDNDGSLVQKINTSYTYWTNFLSGLTTPAPTLAELSADHTWLTDNKSGLAAASSWVSTNGANVLGDHTWLTTNKSGLESAASWVLTNGANAVADHTWLTDNKSGLESAASWISTNGANVLGDNAWLTTNKAGLESAASWVSTNGANAVADHTWLTTNKSGLESAASWVSTNGANVLDSIKDLCGDSTATGDAALGRVGVLEQQIGKLTNATSWIGVVTAKPTSATVTVNGVSTTCVAGDIVTVVNNNAAETGLEYIFDGTNWVELGDSSGSRTRLTALENIVGDANSGLVKAVDTLETTVGDANSGLVKAVDTLETTVGDANSGLVKAVNDIQSDYIKSSDIEFATTADIDTLFA